MAKSGKICWENSKFTVINPNKTFSKFVPRIDEFIRQTCAKRNIAIEEDLVLEEVKPVILFIFRARTLLCLGTWDLVSSWSAASVTFTA